MKVKPGIATLKPENEVTNPKIRPEIPLSMLNRDKSGFNLLLTGLNQYLISGVNGSF